MKQNGGAASHLGRAYVELFARCAVPDEAESEARAGGDQLGSLNKVRDEPIHIFCVEIRETSFRARTESLGSTQTSPHQIGGGCQSMGEFTKIEWADSTWNPWIGCSHAGPGCRHGRSTFNGHGPSGGNANSSRRHISLNSLVVARRKTGSLIQWRIGCQADRETVAC